MNGSLNAWWWQRVSAMVLTLCVAVHLATMIWVVHGGLRALDVIARLHGNLAWGAFYAVFVIAAAVHVPVGLRRIADEWLNWRGVWASRVSMLIGVALALAGLRAVYALIGGGAA
ncbi:succinate dehydrogenase [Paraburkholderia sp. BCC1884]|uniref:succinate dehydrogenase n=1 Tax=Paraburkholderia sp. BCC1884 TaxID=2562668 RepID=UPI001183E097|nr:succinate dehydrogenase [Paraburkholderia sp. BCC1884]